MVHVERTFTVSKSMPEVVDYLKDFSRAEHWDPGTKSCTRSDSGPLQVGSSWHNVSEIRGKQTELTYKLTRLESARLTFVGENKTATSTDDLTFSEVAGGTQVHYDAQIDFHGLAKLAGPFLQSEFESLGDQTAELMTKTINAL